MHRVADNNGGTDFSSCPRALAVRFGSQAQKGLKWPLPDLVFSKYQYRSQRAQGELSTISYAVCAAYSWSCARFLRGWLQMAHAISEHEKMEISKEVLQQRRVYIYGKQVHICMSGYGLAADTSQTSFIDQLCCGSFDLMRRNSMPSDARQTIIAAFETRMAAAMNMVYFRFF